MKTMRELQGLDCSDDELIEKLKTVAAKPSNECGYLDQCIVAEAASRWVLEHQA